MRVKKAEPVKPEDLIIHMGEWAYPEHPFEKTGLEALKRMFNMDLEEPRHNPTPNYEFTLYKVKEITKGRIYLLNPLNGQDSKDRTCITYSTGDYLKFNKEKFEKFTKACPPKYKIGDKVINPYILFKKEEINSYTYPDDYIIDGSINIHMNGKDEASFYQSIKFLEIKDISIKVTFNAKYEKFINEYSYQYCCKQPGDQQPFPDVEITFSGTEDVMSPYTPYNTIWDNVCTSQSPAT
jgi:hypothetical protein